jgi:hypothetical protein
VKKMMKANSKNFIAVNFPELVDFKTSTSRMYEAGDGPGYKDNWWFKLNYEDSDEHDFMVFAGALDYENKDFALFKIPMSWISDNINHLDLGSGGWIFIYLTMKEHIDLRHNDNLSFASFRMN